MSDYTTFEWIILFWFIVIGIMIRGVGKTATAILYELEKITRMVDARLRSDFDEKHR